MVPSNDHNTRLYCGLMRAGWWSQNLWQTSCRRNVDSATRVPIYTASFSSRLQLNKPQAPDPSAHVYLQAPVSRCRNARSNTSAQLQHSAPTVAICSQHSMRSLTGLRNVAFSSASRQFYAFFTLCRKSLETFTQRRCCWV